MNLSNGFVPLNSENKSKKTNNKDHNFRDSDERALKDIMRIIETSSNGIELIFIAIPAELVSTGTSHVWTP